MTSSLKSVITPHYFSRNYVTQLDEAGIDPLTLITVKIVDHTDCQTMANIYTHWGNESLRQAAADMCSVFDPKGQDTGVIEKSCIGDEPVQRFCAAVIIIWCDP